MKKLIILLFTVLLLTSCGKTNKGTLISSVTESIGSNENTTEDLKDEILISEVVNEEDNKYWQKIENANSGGAVEDAILFIKNNVNPDSPDEMLSTIDIYKKPSIHTAPAVEIENNSDNIVIEGVYSEYLPPINNTEPLENLITECQGNAIRFSMTSLRFHHTESAMIITDPTGDNPYHLVPTFLRLNENGVLYTVRKYNCGGYLYEFYDRPYSVTSQSYSTEDKSDVVHTGGIYVENILSFSDFNSLSVGNSIKEVERIDSATTWWLFNDAVNARNTHTSKVYGDYISKNITTLHLLTDGLLTINYSQKGDDYIITDIVYSEDFIYYSDYLNNKFGGEYPKQFKILPQDYPPVD